MKKHYLLIVILLSTISSWGQVGINTTTPATELDVIGDVKTDGSLFLENPGDNTQIRNAKLLIKTSSNDVIRYDINLSKYGPINYTEFIFENLSEDGLSFYDTKIPTSDYNVTVQGYSFFEAGTGDPNIVVKSTIDDDHIEGYQIYAYRNNLTNTWFLKTIINDSKFRINSGGGVSDTPIDLHLNLIIYRNDFITKEQTPITVNMVNSETGIAPLPAGF